MIPPPHDLKQKEVGINGFGRFGRNVVRILGGIRLLRRVVLDLFELIVLFISILSLLAEEVHRLVR